MLEIWLIVAHSRRRGVHVVDVDTPALRERHALRLHLLSVGASLAGARLAPVHLIEHAYEPAIERLCLVSPTRCHSSVCLAAGLDMAYRPLGRR